MANPANKAKFAISLEKNAIEMRVLTTLALSMYDEAESPVTVAEGREYSEALQWVLLQMKERSRTWYDLMTRAALASTRS